MHRRRGRPGPGDSPGHSDGNGCRGCRWLLVVRSAVVRSTAASLAVPGQAVLTGRTLRIGPTVGNGPAVGGTSRWLRHGNLFIKAVRHQIAGSGNARSIIHTDRDHTAPEGPVLPMDRERWRRLDIPDIRTPPRIRGGSAPVDAPDAHGAPAGCRERRSARRTPPSPGCIRAPRPSPRCGPARRRPCAPAPRR